MAYDNTMKIEFYKPKYNLDIKFDGDDSFDLLFKNVSGEFFFSADVEDYDSYVSFEDEECEFTNGELIAKVDISDLMETIANGQLRNTNGTTYGEWIPRIVGDYKTEHDLVFDGKTYADRGYWELFFKEMSKDEIKDFIEFCRDYIDIPNLEFTSRDFSFDKSDVKINSHGYSITINDDLTIEMAEEFTCKSLDAIGVWEMNHDYGDEFEEKKSIKKSLKEGISAFNKAIAKKYNETEPNGAGQYYLDWRFDLHDEKDNIEAIADKCGVTVEFQTDEGYFEVFEESKKFAKRNLKENRFDDIIQCVETLLLDPRVLKSIEGYEKDYTELAYMLAERLDPSDFAMDEDDLAREIKDMLIRGKIKITESKHIKESVEFDYDNHSGVFFAYVDGSDLSIAYAPRKYEDLSGWDISKDGVPIVYDVWEDKSDEYVLNSIKEFEKQLKKYFDTADVKIIMKDFHEKVGKYI